MEPISADSMVYSQRNAECAADSRPVAADNTLRESCKEFEGVLLGIILKESMKTGMLDEEASSNSDSIRDFAIEQTARALGQSEALGISRMLHEQMSR
jgi:Rod binding domain-containing protein